MLILLFIHKASVIVSLCADILGAEEIFRIDNSHVDELLSGTVEHIEAWQRVCESLTRFFWPNNGQHQWVGEPHAPVQAAQFVERLKEVKQLKLMLQQMMAVLAEDGRDSVRQLQQLVIVLQGRFRFKLCFSYYSYILNNTYLNRLLKRTFLIFYITNLLFLQNGN